MCSVAACIAIAPFYSCNINVVDLGQSYITYNYMSISSHLDLYKITQELHTVANYTMLMPMHVSGSVL